jgi:enoyl-CoA hydratase/carnithine racemase
MSTVTYTVRERVAYIVLNRPEKRNAVNAEMRDRLFEIFDDVRDNPEVWVAVLTGEGGVFSTGHDLVEMAAGDAHGRPAVELYQIIEETWKPFIAAIDGYCLAQGAGLALSCDIRIATERAQFGWPQVKRGIASTSGPCSLAHRIPLNIAYEILFTGDFFDAHEAKRLNLVNHVVPAERLREETDTLVRKILANAPVAMRAIKEIAVRGRDMNVEDRVRFADTLSEHIRQSADAKEGLAAFREKRRPVWQGR